MSILDRITEVKRREIEELKQNLPFEELRNMARDVTDCLDFRKSIAAGDCSIIAEVKKHSPLTGSLKEDTDPCVVASVYENNGAAAISVLTDRTFFHGSPEYLRDIKKTVRIPVLRKDFIIDPYQIYETRLMGADALLLISGLLKDDALQEYIQTAMSLMMWPLVEVHKASDIESALKAGAEVIGINNRDLTTFTTDIMTTVELVNLIPSGKTIVSESGIKTRKDVETLMQAGVHAFLIGEGLMIAPDPGVKLRELCGREDKP